MEGLDLQINEILEEEYIAYSEKLEKALNKGADQMKVYLERASPKDQGEFEKSWKIKKEKGKRHLSNSKMVDSPNGKIPLANVLEYGNDENHAFIRKTFDSHKSNILTIIKNEIGG